MGLPWEIAILVFAYALFRALKGTAAESIWVVVKIMVPLWVPIIIRHLLFRVPKKGP